MSNTLDQIPVDKTWSPTESSRKMKPEVYTILKGGLESRPMESIGSLGNTSIPMESQEV